MNPTAGCAGSLRRSYIEVFRYCHPFGRNTRSAPGSERRPVSKTCQFSTSTSCKKESISGTPLFFKEFKDSSTLAALFERRIRV